MINKNKKEKLNRNQKNARYNHRGLLCRESKFILLYLVFLLVFLT